MQPTVIRLDLDEAGSGEPSVDMVEEMVPRLLTKLSSTLREADPGSDGYRSIAVLFVVPRRLSEHLAVGALTEALRGVVGSITIECGRSARINLLLSEDATDEATQETLDWLGSAGSGFVAGSTFDLRGA